MKHIDYEEFAKHFYYDETSPSCLRWKVDRYGGKGYNIKKISQGDIAGSIIMSCADINWPDPGMGQKPMETAEKQ